MQSTKAAPLRTTYALGLATLATLGLSALQQSAQAQQIVVPGGDAATEGNENNGYPFDLGIFAIPSQRYQQVYGAGAFSALPGAEYVTALTFRPDAAQGSAFSSTLPNVQIDLSTTSAAVDGLSSTFSANVGANDQVVFSGPLTLSSADTGPAGGPEDFDITINFATPFLYDPSQGNLLLDVRNFGGGTTTIFNAEDTFGDDVSRVYTDAGGSVNEASGTNDTFGLVTRFTFAPASAPEPSSSGTLVLGGLGAAGLILKAKKRRAVA